MAKYVEIGKISPTGEGTYDNKRTYGRLEIVSTEDSSFMSLKDGNVGNPLEDKTSWQLIASGRAATEAAMNLNKCINEYNVSVQHPTSGIAGSDRYILSQAILLIPEQYRHKGVKCTFIDETFEIKTYTWKGGTFTDETTWRDMSAGGGGGAVDLSERVTIILRSNQSEFDEGLKGATVTVTDAASGQVLHTGTWDGTYMNIRVAASTKYKVEVGEVTGYLTPQAQTFDAKIQSSNTVRMTYKCTMVSVNFMSNQLDKSDISSATATVSYTDASGAVNKVIKKGESARVPWGLTATVTPTNVDRYKTPASQRVTANVNSTSVDMEYSACMVGIRLRTNQADTADIASAYVTVSYSGGRPVVLRGNATTLVPIGTEVTFAASEVAKYATPAVQKYTTQMSSYTADFTYNTCLLTVNIEGNGSNVVQATVAYSNTSELVSSGGLVKVPYGKEVTVSCPDIASMSKPANVVFTPSVSSKSVTMKYMSSGLRVIIDSNQPDKTDINGVKATVKYGQTSVQAASGETIGVPVNTQIEVSFPDVTGYRKPTVANFQVNPGETKVETVKYESELATITLSSNDNTSLVGQRITVEKTETTPEGPKVTTESHLWLGDPFIVKVPFGMNYKVWADKKTGYATPAIQEINPANRQSRPIELRYVSSAIKVNILSNQSNDTEIANVKATVKHGSTTVQAGGGEIVGVPMNTQVTVEFPEVTGYKKPANLTLTNVSGGILEETVKYETEVVTVNISSDNATSMNGQTVTINGVTHTWNGADIVQKIPFGTRYVVSVDKKEAYKTPEPQEYTAAEVKRSVYMKYIYSPIKMGYFIIDDNVDDPATKITQTPEGEAIIKWIRDNSHRVLAKKVSDSAVKAVQLMDTDGTKYFDGTAAVIDRSSPGDVFMQMPEFYYAYEQISATKCRIWFADKNPNDGKKWIKWAHNHLIGVYKACKDYKTWLTRSVSGTTPKHDYTREYSGYTSGSYHLVDWQAHCVMFYLFLGLYKTTDCQSVMGEGNYQPFTTGHSNSLCMKDSSSAEPGYRQWKVNFWGLEDWWGGCRECIYGIHIKPGGMLEILSIPSVGYVGSEYHCSNIDGIPKLMWHDYLLPLGVKEDYYATTTTGYTDKQSVSVPKNTEGMYSYLFRACYLDNNEGGISSLETYDYTTFPAFNQGDNNTYTCARLCFTGEVINCKTVAEFLAP